MKKHVKSFLLRGMLFGGFGPIIAGFIYLILSYTIENFTLTGNQVFIAIISTYLLAFIQAGASIFNQIEGWPVTKSLLFHLTSLYLAYILCYLVNSWIPFDWKIILIFTAIFVATYLIIWISVYLSMKSISKKLNKKI
ncbi:MAG: DUF3021 domain-containing protein [Clostridia bacterium]|nr:DUF3021 domain-containing protein [Clostridia bacterium]